MPLHGWSLKHAHVFVSALVSQRTSLSQTSPEPPALDGAGNREPESHSADPRRVLRAPLSHLTQSSLQIAVFEIFS